MYVLLLLRQLRYYQKKKKKSSLSNCFLASGENFGVTSVDGRPILGQYRRRLCKNGVWCRLPRDQQQSSYWPKQHQCFVSHLSKGWSLPLRRELRRTGKRTPTAFIIFAIMGIYGRTAAQLSNQHECLYAFQGTWSPFARLSPVYDWRRRSDLLWGGGCQLWKR